MYFHGVWLTVFQDLVELFNFHNYDNLRHFAKKHDPRREGGDQRVRTNGIRHTDPHIFSPTVQVALRTS